MAWGVHPFWAQDPHPVYPTVVLAAAHLYLFLGAALVGRWAVRGR